MKKLLSLLSLAVLVTAFGAGCGKYKTCAEANGKGDAVCKKKENFENDKQCTWKPAASGKDADGKCEEPAPASTPLQLEEAKCTNAATDQTTCDAATQSLTASVVSGKTCVFTAGTPNKCVLQ